MEGRRKVERRVEGRRVEGGGWGGEEEMERGGGGEEGRRREKGGEECAWSEENVLVHVYTSYIQLHFTIPSPWIAH